ncbi:MAG: 50S ribosomal protein L29 [Candidatus Riflebacteria bacterium]|nr:50S ribosomal protein L29 [Candidatus Riflebacteria bacterium]
MKNREKLTELTPEELQDKYRGYKEDLFHLRFQVITGQLTNFSKISTLKRNIARVLSQLSKIKKDEIKAQLKNEYQKLISEKGIDPMHVPLKERKRILKTKLNSQILKVKREIRVEVDSKVTDLLKNIRNIVSEKLRVKDLDPKDEKLLRAASKRLRDNTFRVRRKFLDKLIGMGLNEASQIKSLKEIKQAKLNEIERIRSLQWELLTGRVCF